MSEVENQRQEVQVRIERLYLKDASFESPATPGIFTQQWQPKNQVDINTSVNRLGDDVHEVVLSITITTRQNDESVVFVAEVQFAGIFFIGGVNETQLRQVLGVFCPNTLFPYVRENLDTLVVKGGFPALHLAPVNFEALYAQALQQSSGDDEEVTH